MDKVDPFVKVKLKKNGETIWDAKTHTLENCSSPQWNEAFFLDLPMEGGCEVILEELQAVSLATAKGLRFPELGPMLKDAVEALDNAAYFLDVARQAAELTKLMGDMGAVLLEAQLQELLGELDDKVQSFQLKATALEDAVADHVMGHERRRRSSLDVASAARRLFTSTSSTDGRARQSSDQLQQMQVKIDQTVSELRKELKAFKGVKDGVSMEIFQKGDQVQVHSAAQNVWFPDGVVEEILPEDSSEGPKGSMRVRYAHGERQKWEPKFRALQRSSAKLQELLERPGERDRAYRIARDQRIEAERRKALPTGDTGPPLRRWGGVLPGFGAGARRLMMSGMECLKITTRIMLDAAPISERPRGLKALDLRSLMPDADASDDMSLVR
eukprot:g22952.t1